MIAVPLVDRSSFHSFRDDRNRETAWCIDHVSSTKPRLIVGFAEVAAVRRVLRVFAAALGGCGRLGLLDRLATRAGPQIRQPHRREHLPAHEIDEALRNAMLLTNSSDSAH
jgi:hypothetical protein